MIDPQYDTTQQRKQTVRRARLAGALVLGGCCVVASTILCSRTVSSGLHSTIGHAFGVRQATRPALTYGMRNAPERVKNAPNNIVDTFGQYTHADWPGKIHSASELAARARSEQSDLAAHPGPADRDQYGGWNSGPKLPAAGFFRTARVNGRWYLVDPAGHLFLSMGMDTVTTADSNTLVNGREFLFAGLPKPGDPLASHFKTSHIVLRDPSQGATAYNFYEANLDRKFGPNYEEAWKQESITRLRSWGFNTIGSWADRHLYGNVHFPYTVNTEIYGNHNRVSSGSDWWGKMHDPYDQQFPLDVVTYLKPVVDLAKGDPWCVGYFVDNELSWSGTGKAGNDLAGRTGIAYGALAQNAADSPAKQAFLDQLHGKYPDIGSLNSAWGTSFGSWDDLGAPYKAPASPPSAMDADMRAYVLDFARQYFHTIHNILKDMDPDHLYLGCRFANYTPETVQASGEVCDVVSFNYYGSHIDPPQWTVLNNVNKPALISEFHFGATDRGAFGAGLAEAQSQSGRASLYQQYVHSIVDNPHFVGCHWFQDVDMPLTGRTFDGENYGIGFVTITDNPYPEMVAAARIVNPGIYSRRYGRAVTSRLHRNTARPRRR